MLTSQKRNSIAGSILLLPLFLIACNIEKGEPIRLFGGDDEAKAPAASKEKSVAKSPDKGKKVEEPAKPVCVVAPMEISDDPAITSFRKKAKGAFTVQLDKVIERSEKESISQKNAFRKLLREETNNAGFKLSEEASKAFIDNILARAPHAFQASPPPPAAHTPVGSASPSPQEPAARDIPASIVAFVVHQEALTHAGASPFEIKDPESAWKFAGEFLKAGDPAENLVAFRRALQFALVDKNGLMANPAGAVAFVAALSQSLQPVTALKIFMETYVMDRIDGSSDSKAQEDASTKACLKQAQTTSEK